MSEETTTVELEPELQAIADQLDGLTLLQASKLVSALEDKWGVSAAAPAAVAMAAPGGGGAAATRGKPVEVPAEERLEFRLMEAVEVVEKL